jgi:hypothetical protein
MEALHSGGSAFCVVQQSAACSCAVQPLSMCLKELGTRTLGTQHAGCMQAAQDKHDVEVFLYLVSKCDEMAHPSGVAQLRCSHSCTVSRCRQQQRYSRCAVPQHSVMRVVFPCQVGPVGQNSQNSPGCAAAPDMRESATPTSDKL